jgi:hypothetical protein
MEFTEMVAKFGFIFIALGTIIAAVIGAWSYARFLKRAAHTLLFMKYTERYEQIMSGYPEDAWVTRLDLEGEPPPASQRLSLAVLKYLNLCSEEFYMWKKGFIENGVWKIWEGELRRTIGSPLYRREWKTLAKEFESYSEFRLFVEEVQQAPHCNTTRKSVELPIPISVTQAQLHPVEVATQ